ncbi:MAG TPA: 30S ribosomal protein S16 [bacterium]|nr:30S ribosomal protein S16 [bacterium]
MAVKLRLARMGNLNRPYYRMVAAEESYRRDGRFIEIVGFYDPLKKPDWAEVKTESVLKWLSRGAQPTDTVKRILAKAGVWSQWRDVQSGKMDVKAVGDARPRTSVDRGRKPRPSKKAAAKMQKAGAE